MNWEIGIDTYTLLILCIWASLRGSDGKESACNAGDLVSIPGLGRSPVGGHLAYLTYMQSTSCEILGWMKHKLE